MSSPEAESTERSRLGVPWNDRTVRVVLSSTALAPLGVPLISPVLPAFRNAFGLTEVEASLLVSGYFLVGIVVSPFIGLVADRVGRKRVLVTGLALFGLLGGAISFAPSFEAVLALRVVQGTGAAAIFITTVTIIGDTFDEERRPTVLGVNVAVLSAAAAAYPVLGGALVAFGWNVPFLLYFAALPVALFAAVTLDEPPRTPGDRGAAYLRAAVGDVARPSVLGLFGVTFLTEFLAFGVVFTTIPFLLAPSVSPLVIGLVLLAAETVSMGTAAAVGRLSRSFSTVALLALGFLGYGAGFVAIWLAPIPAAIAGAAVLVGGGFGLLLPSVDAAVSERVPGQYRAGAFSLRNSTTFLGRTAGPVVFVALATTAGLGYPPLLLAAGVVAFLAAGVTAAAARHEGAAETVARR